MSTDTLDRPEDTPSAHEEAVISRIKERHERALGEIKVAIERAHRRQQHYLAVGDMRSAEIEGSVKDRRLLELARAMSPRETVEADRRVREEWS